MDAAHRTHAKLRTLAVAACAAGAACPSHGFQEACELELPEGSIMAARRETISQMERLPDACLRTLFMQCSRAAEISVLDLHTAAVCSMGHEALLRKGFAGDFDAMLTWWRAERHSRPR